MVTLLRGLAAVLVGAIAGCSPAQRLPAGAVSLFEVRFDTDGDAPAQPPAVHGPDQGHNYPSAMPSQVFMGNPLVQASFCGLANQPVRLAAATGTQRHEGLEFRLDPRYGHYHIELDLCVEQLGPPPIPANEPQVAIFFDVPDAYWVGLLADGRIALNDAPREPSPEPKPIGNWSIRKPLHFAIDIDVETGAWSIALDGQPAFAGKIEAPFARSVRVLVRGNELNMVGLDDFVAWAEKDLTPEEFKEEAAP